MAALRKISVVKVLRALLTLVCVTGCALAVMSAKRFQSRTKIKRVSLHVTNDKKVRFLNAARLRELLFTRRHIDPAALKLGSTDVHRLEGIARSNPWVQDAQAYIDNGAVLHVTVSQRVPAVRVFEQTGTSYYLDTALQQLPLSPEYAYDAPVVTGVPVLRDDSTSRSIKGCIVALTQALSADTFWRTGVEEIAMTATGEFELIPVLGTHRILMGDTSRLDQKLHTLFLFYRNVLNRLGWDRYTTLDVRYAGQVVASPSLPWTPPVDRALSNINWVKAIVGADTKDESVTPPSTVAPLPATAAVTSRPPDAAAVVKPPVTAKKTVPRAANLASKPPVVKQKLPTGAVQAHRKLSSQTVPVKPQKKSAQTR